MTHDVFVSYANQDKGTADALVANLEQQQMRCWVAPRDVSGGQDWAEEIINAINGTRVMVLVFSGSANGSNQVKREVERAVNRGVTIVPFRIEDVAPAGPFEYYISNIRTGWTPLHHHFSSTSTAW